MSYETERLEKLIAYKKQSWAKIENAKVKNIVEGEIMFLEKHILPIVSRNTSIKHSTISSWACNAVTYAENNKFNGVMFFIPVSTEYEATPRVAIANPNELLNYRESGAVHVYIKELEIINMDGSKNKFRPCVIPISEML